MTVKSKRGRRRYIAFTVSPSLRRSELIGALTERMGADAPRVIQCSEGWCIIRCPPEQCASAIGTISEIDPGSVSLRTSGTLITLRRRYPELMRLRPPPMRRRSHYTDINARIKVHIVPSTNRL
ncbi:MAG: hypothetical protein ACI4Q9_01460 [Candidatus Methanomethylophilaceae archaeon]